MVCRHGPTYVDAADEMVANALKVYNECGDWLETNEITIDLLVYAFAYYGYSVEMYGDQWFGMSLLDRVDGERVVLYRVECDVILDGLAALYLAMMNDADLRR